MSQALSPVSQYPERLASLTKKVDEAEKVRHGAMFNKVLLPNPHLSTKTTLADLRATKGNPLQNRIITLLQLKNSIDEIDKFFPFFERLEKVAVEVLEQVSLFSLQCVVALKNKKVSPVVDVLLKEENFIQIPVTELEERESLAAFTFRVHHIHKHHPEMLAKQAPSKSVPAARVPLMSEKELLPLPPVAFGLITDTQFKSINIALLTPKQLTYAIRGGMNDEKTIQRRLSLISLPLWPFVMTNVEEDILRYVPESLLAELPYERLTGEQIKPLFCNFRMTEEEKKQRVAALSPQIFNSILSKLDQDVLELISDEQIRHLDYPKLQKELLEAIFCDEFDEEENARKIALIPLQSVKFAVEILGKENFSADQISALGEKGAQQTAK